MFGFALSLPTAGDEGNYKFFNFYSSTKNVLGMQGTVGESLTIIYFFSIEFSCLKDTLIHIKMTG